MMVLSWPELSCKKLEAISGGCLTVVVLELLLECADPMVRVYTHLALESVRRRDLREARRGRGRGSDDGCSSGGRRSSGGCRSLDCLLGMLSLLLHVRLHGGDLLRQARQLHVGVEGDGCASRATGRHR